MLPGLLSSASFGPSPARSSTRHSGYYALGIIELLQCSPHA